MAEKEQLDYVKDELLENVNSAIKQLQMDSCQTADQEQVRFTGNMWQVQDLCFQLDCILNHGLKQDSGGYWPFLKEITHKSTSDFILSFPRAISNAVRGWAWLFVALNECAVESYLRSLSTHPLILQRYYLPNALLRDSQRLQVLVMMVAGLEHLMFDLEPIIETACLRGWKSALSEIKYESYENDWAEEAECASLASYDSVDTHAVHDHDPEVATIRLMSPAHLIGEFVDDGDEDIVHSYTRATRRRKKEKSNNNDVYISKDVSNQKLSTTDLNQEEKATLEIVLDKIVTAATTPSTPPIAPAQLSEVEISGSFLDKVPLPAEDEGTISKNIPDNHLDVGINTELQAQLNNGETGVTLRLGANGTKSTKEKRVSFDPDNLVRTLEIRSPVDIPWDSLKGPLWDNSIMSMYERGAPEGQESDSMTSSITSKLASVELSPTSDTFARLDLTQKSRHGRKNVNTTSSPFQQQLVDQSVMESSSRMVSEEIATELHLAMAGLKRKHVEGEVPLENNFHLMIMLEVIVDQQEKVYKVFRATIGHTVGSPADVFLILSDLRFYIAHWDESTGHYTAQASFQYSEIEFLQLSLNYQIINIVCAMPRQRHWICTGNEEVTRNIVTGLDLAIRRNSKVTSPPCIFTDQTCHSLGVQKWVAKTAKIEVKDTKVDLYSLVWWEDPHNAPDVTNPLGPSMEGHLMYRYVGRSVFKKQGWNPGFFKLKAGVFYQFDDAIDRNFRSYVKLIGTECAGCRRSPDADRPHAFELVLSDNRSLQLAASSESESSDWLLALLQTVSSVHSEETFMNFRTPACLILAAEQLFVCHEELEVSSLRLLGRAELQDVSAVHLDSEDTAYCILEFESVEATQSSGDWLIYFPSHQELMKFVNVLDVAWQQLFKIPLNRCTINDPIMIKRYRMQSKLLCRWEKTPHTP